MRTSVSDLQVVVVAGIGGGRAARSALAAASVGVTLLTPMKFAKSVRAKASKVRAVLDLAALPPTDAAQLVACGAAHAKSGATLMVVCESAQLDLLGPLFGTGATLICDPAADELDNAVQDVFCSERPRTALGAPQPPPAARLLGTGTTALSRSRPMAEPSRTILIDNAPAPFWLDILSDLLTDAALARQSDAPEAASAVALLEQTVAALLALPTSDALHGAARQFGNYVAVGSAEATAIERELAARRERGTPQ